MVTLVKHDLEFILKQIEIAEAHAAGGDLAALVAGYGGNDGLAQAHLLPYGLRTVDGSYNNLLPGRENWGASDQSFPGLFTPTYLNDEDGDRYNFSPIPGQPSYYTNNDYANAGPRTGSQPGPGSGTVIDADPRIISNLVVDQTLGNPAAIAAALTHAGISGPQVLDIVADITAAHKAVVAAEKSTATAGQIAPLEAAVSQAQLALDAATTANASLITDAALDQADLGARQAELATAKAASAAALATVTSLLTDLIPNAGQDLAGAIAALEEKQAAVLVAEDAVTAAQNAATASTALVTDAMSAATAALANAQSALDIANAPATNLPVLRMDLQILLDAYGIEMDGDESIYLPNVSPDEGLSSPFNGWMTIFGQFFDHGLDLVAKGGNGTVYVPLSPDDPMYVVGGQNYIPLTRVSVNPGADGRLGTADDGIGPKNLTTPWVDQNQTYASSASKQIFMREYVAGPDGKPIATGHLLEGATGGLANWGEIKLQARDVLGINLTDLNVGNIPLIASDQYGNFIPGANGYPQLIVSMGLDNKLGTADDVLREGNPLAPVSALGVAVTGHAFLDDIAHAAVPIVVGGVLQADTDSEVGYENADGTPGPQGQRGATAYDNELLDRHFITGDGRGNENIALTAVHQVFHAEHNRVVEMTKQVALESNDLNFLNQWLLVDVIAIPTSEAGIAALVWDGERLFQAGRFTTEMEYQHLVFEEFGRMMQPDIDVFVFEPSADINPSIAAEFAHVVYRFGHSMLREDIGVITMDADGNPVERDIALFDGFLNPVMYDSLGSAEEASGAIIRGMSRQIGSEIDEFVTDVLRNHLLGIPLDLAAINLARGRDVGTPPLNAGRQKFFDETGDTLLKPYESWADFALNMKNPASIINFIAAYGTHETLVNTQANPKTIEQLRDAAALLVLGGQGAPTDRIDFLNATGAYANDAKLGGLNDVDFWIGGLAEKKMAFGGMLGSTFSFVFQMTMENLQDADRFYYLSRTQGLNLLNELENNTFAELVMRNTDLGDDHSTALPGNLFSAFEMPTLEMDISKQLGPDPVQDNPYLPFAQIVERVDANNDGVAEYIRINSNEHFTIGGTEGNDIIVSGGGDDAIWGKGGNDRIEAGYGVDKVFGGEGDDIITNSGTDIGEADFLHGNEGNDVIHGGSGLSLLFGNQGNDFIVTGPDGKEAFAGTGDDFILGGTGGDFLLGNEGNDWIEGGDRFDTLAGENSELFFNSSIIGHDVLLGGSGDTDYDGESGDDIMSQNSEGIQRSNGMAGFDWAIHKGDSQAANSDLGIPIFETQEAVILRDRFDLVEGLSGWNKNDTLTGRSKAVNTALELGGTAAIPTDDSLIDTYSNDLLAKNVSLINGLDGLVAHLGAGIPVMKQVVVGNVTTLVPVLDANGNPERIILNTANASDILLGGGGSDVIKGLAGDDVIDGDKWLNVRVLVTPVAGQTWTAFSVDSIEQLAPRMLSGEINPGQLQIVREILDGRVAGDVDTAIYTDAVANYSFGLNSDNSLFIDHSGFTRPQGDDDLPENEGTPNALSDGKDTFRGIEKLQFTGSVLNVFEGTNAGEIINGTNQHDLISGRDGNDTLNGLDGNDILLGGAGADILNGGNGNDVLMGGKGSNMATFADDFSSNSNNNRYNDSDGTLAWSGDWAESGDDNSSTSNNGQINVTGGGLRFDAGNNNNGNGAQIQRVMDLSAATAASLSYSANPDSMEAGKNVQVWFAANGTTFDLINTITGDGAGQTFTHNLVGPFTSGAVLRFTVTALNSSTDIVTLDNVVVTATIPGLNVGVDNLNGGAGNDTYVINLSDGNAVIQETSGTDRIVIGAGTLTGLNAFENAGEDLVLQFNGQQVTVTDHFDNNNEAVEAINLDGATYEAYAFDGDYALSNNAAAGVNTLLAGTAGNNTLNGDTGDDLLFGHDGNDTLVADAGDDLLVGGAGIDRLDGGTGSDTMVGGIGNDTYVVDDVADVVVEALGAGTDTVETDLAAYTLGADVENLTYTGAGTFAGTGNALANRIQGGAGVDTLSGLGGDDTYVVTAGDVIIEAAAGGTDTVLSAQTYTLGAELENLTLTGTADGVNGTGNALNNVITGNDGTNQLFGGGGDDVINGGADNDLLDGGTGNDTLIGGSGNNVVIGGAGDDTINVGSGFDIIRYTATGFGADVITGFDANPANGGQDRIDLSALGITADNFAGRVTAVGGTGADVGDTILTVRNADNSVAGTIRVDGVTVGTGAAQLQMAGNSADFLLAASAPTVQFGIPTNGANTITGNGLANLINGDGGSDTLSGAGGDDFISGGEGADTLNGGDGNDTLSGGTGSDTGTLRDEFGGGSYSNSNGSVIWTGSWTESGGETGGASAGDIQIDGGRLAFLAGTDGGETISRSIDLTGATAANLTFNYQADDLDQGESVVVEAYNGSTWVTLGTLGGDTSGTFSAPLISSYTAIQFRAVGNFETGNGGTSENFYIDNVSIAVTKPGLNAGVDIINGDAGDDTIIWNANTSGPTDGRDVVNGGTEGAAGDTFVINGNSAAETYRIYTRAAAQAAGIAAAVATEILITRQLAGAAEMTIAELSEIEEIRINGVDPSGAAGDAGGDNFVVIGDFSTTNLRLNTITIDGDAGDDTIDISALSSAHRIVFRSNGGHDTILGTLRPEDVIDLGGDPASFTSTVTDGVTTLSNGERSVSYRSSGNGPHIGDDDDEPDTDDDDQDYDEDEEDYDDDTAPIGGDDEDDDAPALPSSARHVAGTAQDDMLLGTSAGDLVFGYAGTDFIITGAGVDIVRAGAGNDLVDGEAGRDIIFGEDGDDDLFGGDDDDLIYGDAGNDRLFGQDGNDLIDAGVGNDTIFGGNGDDMFVASAGDGNDTYYGGEISGDAGIDTLDMGFLTADVTVNLGTGVNGRGSAVSSESGTDALYGIENVVTGSGNDRIVMSNAVNVVDGGLGLDVFVFGSSAAAHGDTIHGFEAGDKIDLSGIDANGATAGNGTFTLQSGQAATAPGQIVITHETREDGEYTVVSGNTAGDTAPEFRVNIAGHHVLTGADFNL